MKQEKILDEKQTAQQLVSDDCGDISTQPKIQRSPYFERNCLSPEQLKINASRKKGTSSKNMVRLSTGEPTDFGSVAPELQKCLAPKPSIGLNDFDNQNMFPKSSTSGTQRLPKHTVSSKGTMPFQSSKCEILNHPTQQKIPDDFQRSPPGLQKFFTLKYTPPKSPFNLIQEELYTDPWKLLVATIFLNKTGGRNAIPVLWKFFDQFPNADATSRADAQQIEGIIQPLGLFRKRAQILIRFSREYLEKMWTYPHELYGIGKYGNDSFRIFCLGEYQDVLPDDRKLNLYHSWLSERDGEGMAAIAI